jgi:hypothetical protein
MEAQNESERNVRAYFKVLSRHFPGGTLINYRKPASIASLWAEFERDTLRLVTDEFKSFKILACSYAKR